MFTLFPSYIDLDMLIYIYYLIVIKIIYSHFMNIYTITNEIYFVKIMLVSLIRDIY